MTGGYSGIGTETVRALRSAGATVTVPARDLKKAKHALANMPDVVIETMDLLDPASIDSFANRFLANDSSHFLINNAGIMAVRLTRDARGYGYVRGEESSESEKSNNVDCAGRCA